MAYVALLRGINVGGNNKVEMARLKRVFEGLGFDNVRTYINSGNVIFDGPPSEKDVLASDIEAAIEKEFGFHVNLVLRTSEDMNAVEAGLPSDWRNDAEMKCDILFLWAGADTPDVADHLVIRSGIDDVKILPGAILWRIDRKNATKTGLLRIVGTPLYKQMTIRNCNTFRKLVKLMSESG